MMENALSVSVFVERERQSEGGRHRKTQRERQTERQREGGKHRDTERDRQKDRERQRERARERQRVGGRHRERETERDRERESVLLTNSAALEVTSDVPFYSNWD